MTDQEKQKFENYLKHFSYSDSYGDNSTLWKKYRSEGDMANVNMKKSKATWIAWVASFLLVIGLGWFGFKQYTAVQSQESIAKGETLLVTLVIGDVWVQKMGSDQWREADVDDQLQMGDKVKTGENAVCEIQMLNRGLFRIESSSEILLKTLQSVDGKVQSRFKLAKGNIGLKPKKLQKGERFEVETRTAVAAVRGTKFSVKSDAEGNTEISVVEGKVAVTPRIEGLESAEKKGQITKKVAEILAEQVAVPIEIVPGEAVKMDQKKVAMLNRAVILSIETISTQSGPITEEKSGVTNGVQSKTPMATAILKEIKKQVVKEVQAESSNVSRSTNEVVNLSDLVAQKQTISEESKKQLEKISEDRILKTLSLVYSVNIKSKIQDAKITLNNEQPVNVINRKLEKGTTVQVKIEKEGFEPWTTNMTVDSDISLNIDLKPVQKITEEAPTNVQMTPTNVSVEVQSSSVSSLEASSAVVEVTASEPAKLPGSVEWKRHLALNGNVSESVRFGDKVALTLGNELYILSLEGKILSKTAVVNNGVKLTRPSVGKGILYVGSDGGGLFAYSSAGKLLWKNEEAGRQPYTGVYPIVNGQTIVHASYDKGVQVFTLDGKLSQSFESAEVIFSTPALVQKGRVLIYGNNNGDVTALQLSDGKQLWRKNILDERIVYPLLALGSGVAVISRSTGKIQSVSVADGSVLWAHSYVSLKRTKINPFVTSGKLVLVNSGGNGVLLVSAKTGSLLYQSGDVSVSTQPVVRGSWLYVGMDNGKVHAVNYKTKKEWSYQSATAVHLLVGLGDNLYAMDTSGMVKLNR